MAHEDLHGSLVWVKSLARVGRVIPRPEFYTHGNVGMYDVWLELPRGPYHVPRDDLLLMVTTPCPPEPAMRICAGCDENVPEAEGAIHPCKVCCAPMHRHCHQRWSYCAHCRRDGRG